jgi:glucose/arabinose dehydrogenase
MPCGRARLVSLAAGLATCLAAARAFSTPAAVPDGFTDQLVVDGLSAPCSMAFLPDGRLLFVEQVTARIRLIVNDAPASIDPVATVPRVNTTGGERGLLGIAVDPGFPSRPYVYVHCTDADAPVIRITRFTVGGDLSFTGGGSLTIDTATRHDLIADIPDDSTNHNGGTLRFGPDGMLYASFGEDGAGCAAQDTSGLRGVILRLDVSRLPPGPGGPPARGLVTPPGNPFPNGGLNARLIWAFGLRNPFRFNIDRLDGTLYIGDVGEERWEEMNRAPGGGLDFGWSRFEGLELHDGSCTLTLAATFPIHSVDRRSIQLAAIIGAPIYRPPPGATRPFPADYDGDVFFSDYYGGFLRRLKGSGTSWSIAPPVPGQPDPSDWATGLKGVSDYAVGPDGSLWYCRQFNAAEIRRIVSSGNTGVPPSLPPGSLRFAPPYPSPATGTVHFAYTLSATAEVELVIFDLRGRIVRRLIPRDSQSAQRYDRAWDGRDDGGRAVLAGLYLARLTAGGERAERRVALVR